VIPPRRHPPQEEGTDSWLMSYADLITLLMCFFIIFISVSEPKKDKFSLITDGLANKFGAVDMSTPLQGVYSALQGLIENNQLFRDMAVQKNEKSLEMELAAGSFFQPGVATLREEKVPVLKELASALKNGAYLDYHIVIESHTSDRETDTTLYASNWELSAARAAQLARFFIAEGIEPKRLAASSFADTQPKVPNRNAAGDPIPENRDLNERVVILFKRG
jgi:chemotaxis protein MotB